LKPFPLSTPLSRWAHFRRSLTAAPLKHNGTLQSAEHRGNFRRSLTAAPLKHVSREPRAGYARNISAVH